MLHAAEIALAVPVYCSAGIAAAAVLSTADDALVPKQQNSRGSHTAKSAAGMTRTPPNSRKPCRGPPRLPPLRRILPIRHLSLSAGHFPSASHNAEPRAFFLLNCRQVIGNAALFPFSGLRKSKLHRLPRESRGTESVLGCPWFVNVPVLSVLFSSGTGGRRFSTFKPAGIHLRSAFPPPKFFDHTFVELRGPAAAVHQPAATVEQRRKPAC